MAVANAGMYDGPTALAEASALASGYTKRKRIVVSRAVHPEAREILRTSARGLGLEIVEIGCLNGITDMDALDAAIDEETAAVILQSPNFFGCIEDVRAAEPLIHAKKGLLVVSANPLSLGLLEAPGALGADVVVGDVQPLGIPAALGGPTCGYLAVTEPLMRRIPGRIVGQTKDLDGKRGFVLTLQAREQHIRREKATSNICSNQALLALCASVYLSVLGKTGIREAALLNLRKAHYAADLVAASSTAASSTAASSTAASSRAASSTAASGTADSIKAASGTAGSGTSGSGLSLPFPAPFFNEFAVKLPDGTNLKALNETLLRKGFIGGCDLGAAYPELKGHMLIAVTERRTKDEIDRFVRELEVAAV
jgi:glycine dehydrogenase subunit 1